MTVTLNLTPPRRRALEALAGTHPRPGRYANVTRAAGPTSRGVALVEWPVAAWLTDAGLVTVLGDRLRLSEAGLGLCREHEIEVRS